jgi:hypothetical protein
MKIPALFLFGALLIAPLFFTARVAAQSAGSAQQGTVLVNPTASQRRSKPSIVTAKNAFGTIQAAVNSQGGPSLIYLTCGIYTENIVISTSDVRILGEERGCVQIQPANPSLPVISIDATNTVSMAYDEVSDLSIICPTGSTCGDGLKITGRLDINQINDNHKFSRLGIYGSFQNGINIAGRTILSVFENIEVEGAAGNGINVATSGVVNALTLRNVRSAHNNNYGIYVNNTQVDLANGILIDAVDAEYNGENTNLAKCAGVFLTGVAQANIENSYFEGNCGGNTADSTAAEVRLTGVYAQSVNIINNVLNLQYGEGGIYNDAVLSTGNYSGNKFDTITNNFTTYIATSHPQSNILLGANFNDAHAIIVPDGNGVTHVSTSAPFGLNYTAVTSVSGNSIDVSSTSGAILYYGPYQVGWLTGGHIGQTVFLMALDVSGHTLMNGIGGSGQILFPDGMNRTLNAGEGVLLYFDGNNWRPIEGSITSQSRYMGTITTTAGIADTIAVPGITGSAHCLFSARNAPAGSLQGMYLSVASSQITLNHSPLAGAVFDVFCSSN